MTGHDQRGPARGNLFPHNPMAATASADEADFVALSADAQEEAVLPAPPAADHDSVSGLDPDVVHHCGRRVNGLEP